MPPHSVLTRIHRRLIKWLRGDRWPGTTIAPNARIDMSGGNVRIAQGTTIDELAVLATEGGGHITLGNRCSIERGSLLLTYGGNITLGDDCSVNPYCILYGHGGLTIGNGVRIAAHTVIIPANHRFDDFSKPIRQQQLSRKGVMIEDDVWIGTGVRVLDGVVIGRGSVVAAGAVVTRSTTPFTINAGVPARVIGQRWRQNQPGSADGL